MQKYRGTVRWFNNAKGYGFLGRDDGGPDVFIHYSAIESNGYKTLHEGEPVVFDIVQGDSGRPQAAQVAPVRDRSPHSAPLSRSPSAGTASA